MWIYPRKVLIIILLKLRHYIKMFETWRYQSGMDVSPAHREIRLQNVSLTVTNRIGWSQCRQAEASWIVRNFRTRVGCLPAAKNPKVQLSIPSPTEKANLSKSDWLEIYNVSPDGRKKGGHDGGLMRAERQYLIRFWSIRIKGTVRFLSRKWDLNLKWKGERKRIVFESDTRFQIWIWKGRVKGWTVELELIFWRRKYEF